MQCYHCSATVPDDSLECLSCGATQHPLIERYHKAAIFAENKTASVKNLLGVAIVVSLVIGAAVGAWIRGASDGRSTDPRVEAAEVIEQVPIESMTDLFMRGIDERLKLKLRSWYKTSDGAVVFEMEPQSKINPRPLWEEFQPKEKDKIMGYLSLAYTQMLIKSGNTIDFEKQGHPVVILTYYGSRHPVALRDRNGNVTIYATQR